MLQQQSDPKASLNHDLLYLEDSIQDYFNKKTIQIDSMSKRLDVLLSEVPRSPDPIHPRWVLCKNNHPLMWEKKDYRGLPCSKCAQKFKVSFWSCSSCNEDYCSKCAPPILFEGKCPMNHSLVSVLSVFEKCQLCEKTMKMSGYMDVQCGLQLCQGCREKMLHGCFNLS